MPESKFRVNLLSHYSNSAKQSFVANTTPVLTVNASRTTLPNTCT
jgi:hypothetical protein